MLHDGWSGLGMQLPVCKCQSYCRRPTSVAKYDSVVVRATQPFFSVVPILPQHQNHHCNQSAVLWNLFRPVVQKQRIFNTFPAGLKRNSTSIEPQFVISSWHWIWVKHSREAKDQSGCDSHRFIWVWSHLELIYEALDPSPVQYCWTRFVYPHKLALEQLQ